jgi:dolichol-phosphate mannosyltransferase
MAVGKDTWAIIPAYNEAKRIAPVIDKIKKHCSNVLVVDDGSSDNTSDIAKSKNVHVLRHVINLGKGAALKTGCDYAVKNNAQKIVLIDADGQHDPAEIPRFLKELESKDIVFSQRGLNRNMPLVMRFGNRFINFILYVLYGIKLTDTQSGYRAFTARAYSKIRWTANDYSVESEMIIRAAKAKLRYSAIPIQTIYLDKYKGTTVIDGIKIVSKMLLWRFLR